MEQSFSHKGIHAKCKFADSKLEIVVDIKGWLRKRHYQLAFDASDLQALRTALLACLDASSYLALPDHWIVKVDNFSWRMFGFLRTHHFTKPPEFPSLAYSDEISLLGMSQSKSRPQTQITDAFIGQRKGEQYLLLRVGQYVTQGIGNMSGSRPDTAVIPMLLLSDLLRTI
ncbi:MAG: hypothetical protein R3E90_16340 [Marinicella sp.]